MATPDKRTEATALVQQRYPDNQRLRRCADDAAVVVLSEAPETTSFDAIARRYADALDALEVARAELTGAIIAADGPETSIAERAGVTRMTVRKARGK